MVRLVNSVLREVINLLQMTLRTITTEQIALISIVVSLIIFTVGKRNELNMKKHEAKKEQYIKFIKLLEKIFTYAKSNKKNKIDKEVEQIFFDLGSSLLLYGSKKLYKKYVFYREFTINPIVLNSRHYEEGLQLFILSDIFIIMRKEVGLTAFNNITNVEALGFFVNNVANNPKTKVKSYRAKYKIFMLHLEMIIFDTFYFVILKKIFYYFIAPILGSIVILLKYFIFFPIVKLLEFLFPNIERNLEKFGVKMDQIAKQMDEDK